MTKFYTYNAAILGSTESVRNVLEASIVNPITHEVFTDEVARTLQAVEEARVGHGDRYYSVAVGEGQVVMGLMGLQPPDKKMRDFATTDNSLEVINAYVHPAWRGQKVGEALLRHLEVVAIGQGVQELVVNSGIRYKRTGWGFWKCQYGEPIADVPDFYDGKYGALVWRKDLAAPRLTK